MVYSRDEPLTPTLRKDGDGAVVEYHAAAWERWARWDLSRLIREHPDALRESELLINCHARDEFGFAEPARRVHRALEAVGIPHTFEIYADLLSAVISPHMVGIGRNIAPALRWAARSIGPRTARGVPPAPVLSAARGRAIMWA
jgi:hypothetical protein